MRLVMWQAARTDKTMSALGLVRGRGPQDTSHCGANDAGDCGKDGAKRKFCSATACHIAGMKNTASIQLPAGEESPHKGGDISDLDDFYAGNLLPKGGE